MSPVREYPKFFAERVVSEEEAMVAAVKSGTRIVSGFATSEPVRFYDRLWDHIEHNDIHGLTIGQALFMGPHKVLLGDALKAKPRFPGLDKKLGFLPPLARAAKKLNGVTQKLSGLELLLLHYNELIERKIVFTPAFMGPANNALVPDNLITRWLYPEFAGRNSSRMGVSDMHSIHFPDAVNSMAYDQDNRPKAGLFVMVMTAPDEKGEMSHGPANGANGELTELVLKQLDMNIILYVSPHYPFTTGYGDSPNTINISRFEGLAKAGRLWVVEDSSAPPMLRAGGMDAGAEENAIANHIVNHIEVNKRFTYGRALQVGFGGTGIFAIKALKDSGWKGRVYTEMLEPYTLGLFEAGKIAGSHFIEKDGSRTQLDGKMVCTFSICPEGSDFYQKLDHNPAVAVCTASRVVVPEAFHYGLGINNCLGIDFHGHVNASGRDSNYYSGVGGLAMINRGLGKGGVAYLCLKSTHKDAGGKLRSSIFPFLPAGSPVSLVGPDLWGGREGARFHLVTEHGIAELSGRSQSEFVRGLISVADPRFQDWLSREAYEHYRIRV